MDILVTLFNPDDFISWPRDRKIERYQRTVEWHDRNEKLGQDKVPFSWGSFQIISQVDPSPITHAHLAVYRVETMLEYEEIMLRDPLRHLSKCTTILLDKLEGDFDTDVERFNDTIEKVKANNTIEQNVELDRVRARFAAAPDFVGKFPFRQPEYPARTYSAALSTDQDPPMEFLIYGMNLEQDPAWDDITKAIHYEKVLWWHHYMAKMISEEKVTHAWGTHDFCDIGLMSSRSASAVAIYKAKNLAEFADVYKQDPLRTRARFWSVALKPISLQRQHDELILSMARENLI